MNIGWANPSNHCFSTAADAQDERTMGAWLMLLPVGGSSEERRAVPGTALPSLARGPNPHATETRCA